MKQFVTPPGSVPTDANQVVRIARPRVLSMPKNCNIKLFEMNLKIKTDENII